MENAILDEIRSELSALKERVAALEKQLDEYERLEAEELREATETQAEEPAETIAPEAEVPVTEDLPEEAEPAPVKIAEDTGILEDPLLTSPDDDSPIDLGIDLPDFGSGAKSINDVQSRKIRKRLMDNASASYKWKTDLPGSPVRNIISAISLNDRVLMINKLFHEDPQLFQQTIADLNSLDSFAEAENYINGHFSDWKMDSEPVYRFMMAVRRKLN